MDFSIVNTPGTPAYHPDSYWKVRVLNFDPETGIIAIRFIGDLDGRVNGILKDGSIATVPADQFIDPTFLMLEEAAGHTGAVPPYYGWIPDPSVVGSEGWVSISLYWAESEGWL